MSRKTGKDVKSNTDTGQSLGKGGRGASVLALAQLFYSKQRISSWAASVVIVWPANALLYRFRRRRQTAGI